jgi:hypothetical protein
MHRFINDSICGGHYRLARQPRPYRGKRAPAWIKIELEFAKPVSALQYWILVDALTEGRRDNEAVDPHAFLRYCIRQGWLERV